MLCDAIEADGAREMEGEKDGARDAEVDTEAEHEGGPVMAVSVTEPAWPTALFALDPAPVVGEVRVLEVVM